MAASSVGTAGKEKARRFSDVPFFLAMGILGSVYVALILAMLIADACYTSPGDSSPRA